MNGWTDRQHNDHTTSFVPTSHPNYYRDNIENYLHLWMAVICHFLFHLVSIFLPIS